MERMKIFLCSTVKEKSRMDALEKILQICQIWREIENAV